MESEPIRMCPRHEMLVGDPDPDCADCQEANH